MRVTRKSLRSPELRMAGLVTRFERHRRVIEQEAQLGAADQRLLWMFSDEEPRTLREIAVALRLEQSTVNRQVNAARKAGLLERTREPGQAAALYRATPEGLERFHHDLDRAIEVFGLGLAAVDPAERDALLRNFEAFVDAFGDALGH